MRRTRSLILSMAAAAIASNLRFMPASRGAVAASILLIWPSAAPLGDGVELHFLDVGQGDAALVTSVSGLPSPQEIPYAKLSGLVPTAGLPRSAPPPPVARRRPKKRSSLYPSCS